MAQTKEIRRKTGIALRLIREDPPGLFSVASRKVSKRLPFLKAPMARLDYGFWRAWLGIGAALGRRTSHPLTLRAIRPSEIRSFNTDPRAHHRRANVGKILDGDWELHKTPLGDHEVFAGIQERFTQGRSWQDTQVFAYATRKIAEQDDPLRYTSADVMEQRFAVIDDLHEQIQSTGYKTQQDLGAHAPWDEVIVCVGRDGELALVDGWHRFSIAVALNLETIPALVNVTHRQWQDRPTGTQTTPTD